MAGRRINILPPPLFAIRFPGGKVCNIFEAVKDESEIWSFKFSLDQKLGEIQWLRRSR